MRLCHVSNLLSNVLKICSFFLQFFCSLRLPYIDIRDCVNMFMKCIFWLYLKNTAADQFATCKYYIEVMHVPISCHFHLQHSFAHKLPPNRNYLHKTVGRGDWGQDTSVAKSNVLYHSTLLSFLIFLWSIFTSSNFNLKHNKKKQEI